MYKKVLTEFDIKKIKEIWYFKDIKTEEKARELYNIISYDDLIGIANWYTSLGYNIVEEPEFRDLSEIRVIYTYCEVFGLFNNCKSLEQKIDTISKSSSKLKRNRIRR